MIIFPTDLHSKALAESMGLATFYSEEVNHYIFSSLLLLLAYRFGLLHRNLTNLSYYCDTAYEIYSFKRGWTIWRSRLRANQWETIVTFYHSEVDHYPMLLLCSCNDPLVMAKVICVHLVCELGYDMLFQVRSTANVLLWCFCFYSTSILVWISVSKQGECNWLFVLQYHFGVCLPTQQQMQYLDQTAHRCRCCMV